MSRCPAVHNPPEAWAEDAPRVFDEEESNVQAYKHIARGDADTAIQNSKYVISQHFETPWTEHAFLSRNAARLVHRPLGWLCDGAFDPTSPRTRRCTSASSCSALTRSACRISSSAAASAEKKT